MSIRARRAVGNGASTGCMGNDTRSSMVRTFAGVVTRDVARDSGVETAVTRHAAAGGVGTRGSIGRARPADVRTGGRAKRTGRAASAAAIAVGAGGEARAAVVRAVAGLHWTFGRVGAGGVADVADKAAVASVCAWARVKACLSDVDAAVPGYRRTDVAEVTGGQCLGAAVS
jgi:hypothetical protein